MPHALVVTFSGALGLLIGSFLNVVIHRVPLGASIVHPSSACPRCGHQIRNRDNVPVLSWLLLRGKCRDCGAPISLRYPLIELGTAVLFAVTAARFPDTRLPAYIVLAATSVALAGIDLDVRRLPDVIVLPAYPAFAVLLLIDRSPHDLARAAIGAALLFAFFYIVAVIAPTGMGFGDVKLAGLVGGATAYLSWGTLLTGAFAGFLLGAVAGGMLIAAGRAGRKSAVPFGPFMLLGAWAAILGAGHLGDAYLGLL